jgi:RNA polymerase sigma-70 factor, ECF subfamily
MMLHAMAELVGLRGDAPGALVDDRSMLADAIRGDRQALAALLRAQAQALHSLCFHVCGPDDARDAAQESLERVVRSIAQFDPARGDFRTWALTVARNVCRDRLRRRGLERAAFLEDGDGALLHVPAAVPDPEHLALARADTRAVMTALAELPDGQHTALVLFHVHERSYEQIASALAVPIGTVMTWLFRGRKRLRDAMRARAREGSASRAAGRTET